LGRNQAAVDDFTKILDLKPDFDKALYQRAGIYCQEGEFSLAKKDLEAYLKTHPGDTSALSTVKRDRISIEIEEGIETNTLLHYI
jgi:DnaJ family protein C protein 3